MLAQALDVIEAARRLSPGPVPGLPGAYRVGCLPREVPAILRDLALALEAFDAVAASRSDPYAAIARALRFAESMGVDRGGMIAAMRDPVAPADAEDGLPVDEARLDPAPGDVGPPDPTVLDPELARSPERGTAKPTAGTAPSPRPLAAPFGKPAGPGPAPVPEGPRPSAARRPGADIGTGLSLEDGDESADDLGLMVDAIENRLESAAARGASPPTVARLMAAVRRARRSIMAREATAAIRLEFVNRIDAELRAVEEECAPALAYRA